MTRRKKNEEVSEGWERRIIEIENQLKEQTKKIETHEEEIQKVKKEHKEEIQNLKVQWEEIHSQKIRETEEKYKTIIEEMENRYIVTFRNLGDNYQQNSSGQKQETYRGPVADITKPLFYGSRRDIHPIDFLNRLNEYFTVKQIIHTDEKLIMAGDCLRATASSWFATIRFQINSFQDFQNTFRDEYWSRDIQMQTWSQCLSTKQIQTETSYREHFSYWATKLRHLEVPRLSENEIVSNIAGHYPGYLRAILISLPECTILNAMKILGTEEHRRSVNQENSNYGNRQQQNRENQNYGNRQDQNRGNHNHNFRQQREEPQRRESNWNNRIIHRNDQPRDDNIEQLQYNNPQWRDRRQINQVNIEETSDNGTHDENQTEHVINNVKTNNASVSPYLKCNIENEAVYALVDTGATISVINKELADQLLKKNQDIPVLPINSVQISNAVGRKICKVSKQLFCRCEVGDKQLFINFVQVENLNEMVIIGADVLNQYNVHINFTDKTIQWSIQDEPRVIPFAERITEDDKGNDQVAHLDIIENAMTSIPLNPLECETFNQLIREYQEIFSDSPGLIHEHECQIKITPGEHIYQKPYPIPISRLSRMDKEIQRMLSLGIIEKSESPWSSPIIGIEKKNGDIRLCLDARQINKRIIPDRECPMGVDEILIKFQGAKYLSTIDLTAGYWQCRLKEASRPVTAFLHRGRNYQFKVLPFGLVNSVAEFQKVLDKVLGPEVLAFTATYVDDIHITSTSFDEHMKHLQAIFQRFADYNVKVNIHKSQFLRQQITFLGHVISEKGIGMDPEKIRTIQEFQPPRNQKQARAFLGFINFYRKYIRDLSQLTEKISQLTKKGNIWHWGNEQQTAFEQIKKCFLDDIIVKYPNFERPFYLATDASGTHVGAELYQIDQENRHGTIGFTSRTLNSAERKYYTTERELLAIVFGCKKYRNYILGHTTHLLTDHQALTFLNSCRLLNGRLMRWSIQIQEFNLQIKYIAGKDNIGADTLTRYTQTEEDQIQTNQQVIINQLVTIHYSKELRQKFKQLFKLQQQDSKIVKIKQRLGQGLKLPYQIYNGLLFYIDQLNHNRLMIPEEMAQLLIKEVHEEYGHCGATKVYQLLKVDYQLSHMLKTIKRITQACDLCQKSKIYNQRTRGPLISNIPGRPHEIVSLDLIGPLPSGQLGARYLLVMLDVFSKYVQIYPLRRATTNSILNKIEKYYIPICGKFKKILTDNGTQFHSKQWTDRLRDLGIQVLRTTTYHPAGNPVERANREIGRILRTYCHSKHTKWVSYIKKIEFWINNTTHSTTGYTPQSIMGKPHNPVTLRQLVNYPDENHEEDIEVIIQLARKKMKRMAELRNQCLDKGKKFIQYTVGQQVLIKEHKLSSAEDHEIKKLFLLYRGPVTIVEVRNNNTVIVIEANKPTIYNMQNIKPYISPGITIETNGEIPSL